MTLGNVIRSFRDVNNLTMDDFARMSGLSKSYISMLENNKDPRGNTIAPSIETIDKVANAIGVDIDTIINQIDQDVVINRKKVIEYDANDEIMDNWKFIKYCFDHASLSEKNQVLSILKVREKWAEFKEMESLFIGSE